jgi:SPP1 gp7 family putative phage head morphogenesis protein
LGASDEAGDQVVDLGWHADYHALTVEEQGAAARVVGSPALVTARALISSVPAWQTWRDAIANVVMASDEASLAGNLEKWEAAVTSDDALATSPIAASIYEASMHADLAGQLFVRAIEVPEAGERANAATVNDPFLSLTFDDALRYFLARRLVTPEQFAALSDEARQRSFTASRLASAALIQRCRDLLAASIESGSDYATFASGIVDESITLGIEPADPGYLTNVYRTNVVSSYGAGRYRQLTSPAVRAARPFVEFRAVMDSRTRPTHASLHRKVFSQDDPDWGRYAPPLSYQCRCTTVARRAEDVDRGNVITAASIDFTPDFNAAPTLGDAG